MEKKYLKPEVIEETLLERKLVYAKLGTPREHCTTLVGMNDQDSEILS